MNALTDSNRYSRWWQALVTGQVRLVRSEDGPETGYRVVENPPESHSASALTDDETEVLELVSRGVLLKAVALDLGLNLPTLSNRLGNAARKLGLSSSVEAIHVAALLTRNCAAPSLEELTTAERDVLSLVERRLSNAQIATARSRSVRTIANQVASVLRKTGAPSRRALIAAAAAQGSVEIACVERGLADESAAAQAA